MMELTSRSADFDENGKPLYVYNLGANKTSSFERSLDTKTQAPLRKYDKWSNYNMNFLSLSNQLTMAKKKNKQLEKQGFRRVNSTVSIATSTGAVRSFAEELDKEVEKIVMFYLHAQGEIAKNVWKLRETQVSALDSFNSLTINSIDRMCERFREFGIEVVCLLNFLDFNVLGLRKIIKRHDLLFDQKMGSMYFDTRIGKSSKNSQLVQLYHQEGVRAIIGSIRRGLEELYDAKDMLEDNDIQLNPPRMRSEGPASNARISNKHRMLSFSSLRQIGGSNENLGLRQRNMSTNNLFGQSKNTDERNFGSASLKRAVSDLEPVLQEINDAANRVIQSQKTTTNEYLAAHSTMALEIAVRDMKREDEDEEESEDIDLLDQKEKKRTSHLGLHLNLFVTFLYMSNQYIIAPTSGQYADLLGMSPSMSGLIIAMSPAAALVSSLLYSMWTNHSFRFPLICGLSFSVLGNLLYATALQCHSPMLLFAGRLMCGLGGPRVISRRYIADHVATEDRTNASSAFVTAGAMGLAFGPLIASLIARMDTAFDLKLYGTEFVLVAYKNVTAPGWIMMVLWGFALTAVICFFREPPFRRASKVDSNSTHSPLYATSYPSHIQTPLRPSALPLTPYSNTHQSFPSNEASPSDALLGMPYSMSASPQQKHSNSNSNSNSNLNFNPNPHSLYGSTGNSERWDSKMNEQAQGDSLLELGAGQGQTKAPSTGSPTGYALGYGDSCDSNENHNGASTSSDSSGGSSNSGSSNNLSSASSRSGSRSASPKGKDLMDSASFNQQLPSHASTNSMEDWSSRPATYRAQLNDIHDTSMERPSSSSMPRMMYNIPFATGTSSMFNLCASVSSCLASLEFISLEVHLILFLYVVNKTGQELAINSIPSITTEIFSWSEEGTGYFMACLGFLVLPTNIIVNQFVKDVDDRDLILRLSYMSMASVMLILNMEILRYSLFQYATGVALLWAALNSLEGIMMSLLSKLVSPELAKGTFNSGLLATEAGTLGRVFGDLCITAFTDMSETIPIVNLLYFPLVAGITMSILMIHRYFDLLDA